MSITCVSRVLVAGIMLAHSFDFCWAQQQTLHSYGSCIRLFSSPVYAKPVSFWISTKVLAGHPGLFLPWVGSHKTNNEEAGSPGCLRQGPASLSPCSHGEIVIECLVSYVLLTQGQLSGTISSNLCPTCFSVYQYDPWWDIYIIPVLC